MGLGKTDERDFKTHEFFADNPFVHRYYDSARIDHHPRLLGRGNLLITETCRSLHKDLARRIQQLTRFDEIIIVTLRSDYTKASDRPVCGGVWCGGVVG